MGTFFFFTEPGESAAVGDRNKLNYYSSDLEPIVLSG